MRTTHAFGGAGLVVAGGLVLLLWRCRGGPDEPAREPHAGSESATEDREARVEPPPGAEGAALAEEPVAPGAASGSTAVPAASGATPTGPVASGSAAPASPAAARINAAMARDPKGLALFARIERELKRDPPPDVHAIVALYERGATREELLAETRRRLANDFQLRALVVRWIDEVAPPPSGAATTTPAPARSGPPLVQPIRPK